MYAIKHKKKNKLVSYIRKDLVESNPDRVKLSNEKPYVFKEHADALYCMVINHLSKNVYEIVKVMVREVVENEKQKR